MALTTFAELKASIADWLNRSDLTTVIPDFITLAEHQMEREVRHYKMIERSNANLDSRYSQVPSGWLETIRFTLNTGDTYRLEMVSIDDLSARRRLIRILQVGQSITRMWVIRLSCTLRPIQLTQLSLCIMKRLIRCQIATPLIGCLIQPQMHICMGHYCRLHLI